MMKISHESQRPAPNPGIKPCTGANGWQTDKIVSVKDVMKELVTEAEANL